MTGPLDGVRVIELAGIGPAPFAAMLLAELGADVIRVDRPGETAAGTDLLNRGKRSIQLDLKQRAATEAALRIAAESQLFIEGYRPGVAERLGLGPADVHKRNPQLVYGRMTGWGQDGPLAATAGHDINYIAITGALHAIGRAGGPPQIPLNLLGDFGGGALYLVIGLLAALREASVTGVGRVVDAAIVDGTSHLLAIVHGLLAAGRWRDERGVNLLDGGAPFYSVYETADQRHMAVGALEPKFYAELLQVLELDDDPFRQYETSGWPALRHRIQVAFAARTQEQWVERFHGADACVAPVLSLHEAALHPHLAARGTLVEEDGTLQAAPAPRFDGRVTGPPSRPPVAGEHTTEILRSLDIDVDGLLESGAAVQADR